VTLGPNCVAAYPSKLLAVRMKTVLPCKGSHQQKERPTLQVAMNHIAKTGHCSYKSFITHVAISLHNYANAYYWSSAIEYIFHGSSL
jgi:hypothetical protein